MKNQKRKYTLSLLLYFIIFGSVIPTLDAQYVHINENGINTLLVSDKYETKIGVLGNSRSKGQEHKAKFLFTFSPIQYLSASLGYFKLNSGRTLTGNLTGIDGSTISFNIGTYFKKNTDPNDQEKHLLTTFKLGLSKSNIQAITPEFKSKFNNEKYFAQLSFGHHFRRCSWDLFFKYNILNFVSGEVDLDVVQPSEMEVFDLIEQEKYFNTMEFKGQLSAGGGFIQIVTGFSYEFPLNKLERFYFLEGGGVFFGTNINFNKFIEIVKKQRDLNVGN